MEKAFRIIDLIFIIIGFIGILILSIAIYKRSTADNMLSAVPLMIGFVSIFIAGYLRFDRKKL